MSNPRFLLAALLAALTMPAAAAAAAPADETAKAKEAVKGPAKPATPPETDIRRKAPAPAPVAAPAPAQTQAAKKKVAGPQKSGDDDDISDLDVERRTARKATRAPPPKTEDFRAGKAVKDHLNATPPPPPPPTR